MSQQPRHLTAGDIWDEVDDPTAITVTPLSPEEAITQSALHGADCRFAVRGDSETLTFLRENLEGLGGVFVSAAYPRTDDGQEPVTMYVGGMVTEGGVL